MIEDEFPACEEELDVEMAQKTGAASGRHFASRRRGRALRAPDSRATCYGQGMIPHQRWTQSHITELRSRLELGASPADIAESLQRPLDNVLAMMSRLRLRSRV